MSKNFSPFDDKNGLAQTGGNVPLGQLVHNIKLRKYVSENKIKEIAIEKYRSSGNGITFEDVRNRFFLNKPKAQRRLKHFHAKGILFTAEDVIRQGITLLLLYFQVLNHH